MTPEEIIRLLSLAYISGLAVGVFAMISKAGTAR